MSFKRPRKSTTNSASDESFSGPEQFSPKVKRASLSALSKPVSCNLPPTCNPPNAGTICSNSREFEQHYATYHTHICTAPEVKRTPTSAREVQCGKVFPDSRFLDLHISECHDPLVAVRRDRGERTFTCFVETCDGTFTTPKGRRLHLIDAHKYPKEYYFSVTTKGVGDILNKWGQGASLLRKEWKTREPREKKNEDAMDVEPKEASPRSSISSDERAPVTPTDAIKPDTTLSQVSSPGAIQPIRPITQADTKTSTPRSDLDDLTSGLSSLTLVPRSIRFGRGGRSGGMLGRGTKADPAPSTPKAAEGSVKATPPSPTTVLGSGRRPSRGRGVAHAFGVVGRTTGTE